MQKFIYTIKKTTYLGNNKTFVNNIYFTSMKKALEHYGTPIEKIGKDHYYESDAIDREHRNVSISIYQELIF